LPSIAGGLKWNGQSAGRISVQRCSDLYSGFHFGVFISRKCSMSGEWEDVDFSRCTMHLYSTPVIVAERQVISNTKPDIDEFQDEVCSYVCN